MSVKMHLMWNSKMLIDGGSDSLVATSLLEASNLVVLKVIFNIFPSLNLPSRCFHVRDHVSVYGCQGSSVIHSNANLGVHGQGFLNLSGPGNLIQAQRLILSLFYSVKVSLSPSCIFDVQLYCRFMRKNIMG